MTPHLSAIFRAFQAIIPRRRHERGHGFSLTELIVVIVILTILLAISLAALSRANKARSTARCAANLRSLGLAFQNYAADNSDYYPLPTTSAQWEDLLRPYIHRPTLCCPVDQELFPATGSSYDWRDTGDPLSSLPGRRLTEVTRDNISLAFDALPGWHEQHKIQVVCTDTSVHSMDDMAFLRELQLPVVTNP